MLTQRFDEALAWASGVRREQTRKATEAPFISHLLLAVTALVIEAGDVEDEAVAAVLHDAIEDQGGPRTREEIRRRFGDRVTELVDSCTDAEEMPKPPWRERKEAFIATFESAPASIRPIVTADKLHNVTCSIHDLEREGPEAWKRFRGREKALWYYQTLTEALEAAGANALHARASSVRWRPWRGCSARARRAGVGRPGQRSGRSATSAWTSRSQSSVARSPSSNPICGSNPRSRRARLMSACESRTSPARSGPYWAGRSTSVIFCIVSQTWLSDTRPPQPQL